MLAVACLQVSAKYEEAEENVPAVNQLSRASGIPLTVQIVQKWEVLALESLGGLLLTICVMRKDYLCDILIINGCCVVCHFTTAGWQLTCIVPMHFLEYYLSKGVLFYGDFAQGKPLTLKSQQAPQQMRKYLHFFAHYIMVQEYSFRKYPPSYLAAVIVYASRCAYPSTHYGDQS